MTATMTFTMPALMAQMERMILLKYQQQTTEKENFIDPQSPYFGHMRLREEGRIIVQDMVVIPRHSRTIKG